MGMAPPRASRNTYSCAMEPATMSCVTEAVTVCVQVGHRLAFNFTVAFAYYSFFYVSYRGQKKG